MSNTEGNSAQPSSATGGSGAGNESDAWRELRAAKEYAEAIVETLHEPLLVLTPDLRVERANPAFYSYFQVTPEETEGELIHHLGNGPWNIPELRKLLEDVLPDGNAFDDFEVTHDLERVGRRTMLVNARRLDPGPAILLGTRDITERKRADEALSSSEQRYRTLFEAMDEAYAVVEVIPDDEGKWVDFLFLEVNPAFIEHTGMEYPVGRTATQLLGTPNPRWAQVYGQVAETGVSVRFEEQEMTLGRTFDLYVFRLGGPGSRRVAVLFSDIAERKQAEAALRRLTETLEARVRERTREVRTLASWVLLAEQRERERIAQLLHDDVQQTLHSLNIRIHNLVKQHGLDRENNEDVAEAFMILRSAVRGTRSLSAVINPPVLQHGGLGDALRWLADHMLEWHELSVDVHLDLDEPVEIDEVRRLLAFHSVRELLFNVVKHAGVQHAKLAARLEGDELVLEVSDEGRGFDVEEALARKPAGFGLATIRERVRFHGGDLEVDSTRGRGTRKTLRLPVA